MSENFIPIGRDVYRVPAMERSALTGLYRPNKASVPASVTGGRDATPLSEDGESPNAKRRGGHE